MALTATVYHVDLSKGSIETKTLPEDVYRKYPGGSALAAYLLMQNIPVGADPLGPENVLVMAVSPLTGLIDSTQDPIKIFTEFNFLAGQGPSNGMNVVTCPSKRKMLPCTTGILWNSDASFTR